MDKSTQMNREKQSQLIFILNVIIFFLILYSSIVTYTAKVLSDEYNKATSQISEDSLQIKQLTTENRDLEIEYNELLKDNDENIKHIEWLNDQMVILRGE